MQLLTGKTGSGKTYTAIKEAESNGNFIYIAPCRQLVAESFIDYATTSDSLRCGDTHIKGNKNMFAVYESAYNMNIENYQTLIVDEAHFLTDYDRGYNLLKFVKSVAKTNTNIVLLTATDNLCIGDYWLKQKVIRRKLKSIHKKPDIVLCQTFSDFMKKAENESTLIFCPSRLSAENMAYYEGAEYIHGGLNPAERIDIQYRFKYGMINHMYTTNVAAQGLNFPCSALAILQDGYETPEQLIQKKGRLGRYGFKQKELNYLFIESPLGKPMTKKCFAKKPKKEENYHYCYIINDGFYSDGCRHINIENNQIISTSFEEHELMMGNEYISYENIRYGIPFIKFLKNCGIEHPFINDVINYANKLNEEFIQVVSNWRSIKRGVV